MPRFFVKQEQIEKNNIIIIGEDVKHIKNVLRKKQGDNIEICNQDSGESYTCEIEKVENEKVLTKIIEKLQVCYDSIKVDIYQGLPKADKMELIIQKSVELGANSIIPVAMKRCVVKIEPKEETKKISRWQKIAESAAKQCGRDKIPIIKSIATTKDILTNINDYDVVLVAYENEKENTLKQELKKLKEQSNVKIAILIGPEGGLEEKDVEELKENGAKIITLGNRILRTETVALNMLSIIMYELEG